LPRGLASACSKTRFLFAAGEWRGKNFKGIFFSATLEAFLEPWKATPLTFAPGFPDFHSISLLL
jgi:hypothetical protein